VGAGGAQALCELLMYNQTLSALDLRGNAFGNDGAIVLGRGLRAMVRARAQGACASDCAGASCCSRRTFCKLGVVLVEARSYWGMGCGCCHR